MVEIIRTLNDNFGVFIILTGVVATIVITTIKAVATMVMSSSRERTRREIAAYIAEGTISAEQGERLLKAQVNGKEISL